MIRMLARSMPFLCIFGAAALVHFVLRQPLSWPGTICGVWLVNLFAPWHKDAA